jgi:hypothetical protein
MPQTLGYASEIDPADPRQEVWAKQREERGFDNTELWNLDATIARFLAPRLRAFKAVNGGYPPILTWEEWGAELDKMALAFETIAADIVVPAPVEQQRIEEGLDSFRKYFHHLWY